MNRGAISLIKQAKEILLITHQEAAGDGDALGSLLGFSSALKKLGKNVHPILDESVLVNFSFLPGLENLKKEIPKKIDLVIFLDFADLKRGISLKEVKKLIKKIPSILIDHHPKGDLFDLCTFKIHNPKTSSVTEILYYLIKELEIPLDKNIATCLLTGIFTDTNSFQNPNTTEKTLEVASFLLASGARIEKIAKHAFYEKPLGVLKLWGKALLRLWRNPKYNLLITTLISSDFSECRVGEEGANGVANFLSLTSIPDVSAILVLIEENGKIKGSLRTQKDQVDVSKLAKVLGGGGHPKAAGFSLQGGLKYKEGKWEIV